MNIFKEIFRELNTCKIEYLIVGGVAVNLYGYSRFTGDLDILMALDDVNIQKMEKLMKKLGYASRIPVELKELRDPKKLKSWIKEKNLKAYSFIHEKNPMLSIDILVEESLDFQQQFKKKSIIEVWDMALPVASLEELISMKKKSKRSQDLMDIKALLEFKSSK